MTNGQPTCKTVCAGKKGNLLFEQCRDSEGKITSMRRIGDCGGEPTPVDFDEGEDSDIKLVDDVDVDVEDDVE